MTTLSKEANLFFGSRLACLRNQKCTIYENQIVTDEPQREANDTYRAFKLICPDSIPIINGRLSYTPPESGTIPKERKRRRKTDPSNDETNGKNKHRGRPKGAKNRKTLEREAALTAEGNKQKRGRGRPKGSKNKKTREKEASSV